MKLFIAGSTRSGTTHMAYALAQATRLRLYSEGHIWPLLAKLDRLARDHRRGIVAHVNREEDACLLSVKEEEIARSAWMGVSRLFYTEESFIDKTPGFEAIQGIPFLSTHYQDAQFIVMIRHPLTSVASKLRKFPTASIEAHLRDWLLCYRTWLTVRDQLPPHSFCEIKLERLTAESKEESARIAQYLQLDVDSSNRLEQCLTEASIREQTSINDKLTSDKAPNIAWPDGNSHWMRLYAETAEQLGYSPWDLPLPSARPSISLYFPMGESGGGRVYGANAYSYSIDGGMQLCPNNADQELLELRYSGIPHPPRRLTFSARKEYIHGPAVIIGTRLTRDSHPTLTGYQETIISLASGQDVQIEFTEQPFSSINTSTAEKCSYTLSIYVRLAHELVNDFSTILLINPTLHFQLTRPCA